MGVRTKISTKISTKIGMGIRTIHCYNKRHRGGRHANEKCASKVKKSSDHIDILISEVKIIWE